MSRELDRIFVWIVGDSDLTESSGITGVGTVVPDSNKVSVSKGDRFEPEILNITT